MLKEAINLLIALDKPVFLNLANTLEVTGYAVILALIVGLPLGAVLGVHRFKGRKFLLFLFHLWLYLPLVGLGVFLLHSEQGVFPGPLLYILLLSLITLPLLTSLIGDVLNNRSADAVESALAVGASTWQLYTTLLNEYRSAIFGAIAVGIARIFAEVGAFYLVLSAIYSTDFPAKPQVSVTGGAGNLAVAIALFLCGGIVYVLIYLTQFRRGEA